MRRSLVFSSTKPTRARRTTFQLALAGSSLPPAEECRAWTVTVIGAVASGSLVTAMVPGSGADVGSS